MKTEQSIDRTIKQARGNRRKQLIGLKQAIEAKKQWSPEKKQLNQISVELNQAIKDENWPAILDLSYKLKSLAFETINQQKQSSFSPVSS